jgi:uncharacterized SAM-binding protein YcdF (DUF218 family)
LLIVLFLTISFLPIGTTGIKYLERDYFKQKKINKIDNIIVLGGSERVSISLLTNKTNLNESSERLIATVKLSLDNPNATIFFLGGDGKLIKQDKDEGFVAKGFFNDVGFNTKKIIFIKGTRNTVENLQAFKELNITNKSNVLITSAAHMKRAMMITKKMNIKVIPYAVDFRSSRKTKFILLNFIQGFDITSNLSYFNNFFREILGILAFKIFY